MYTRCFWQENHQIYGHIRCIYTVLANPTYDKGWPKPYIYRYIRCIHGVFGREITKYMVIYGVYIRSWPTRLMIRVGQNHTFIGIYGVYTEFLAGKSPFIRSYTVCIYGPGQPYLWTYSYLKHKEHLAVQGWRSNDAGHKRWIMCRR